MDEIKSVGPEGYAPDRGAAKIFFLQLPARSPGQKQGEAERDEGEAKGAREIRIIAESQPMIFDLPQRCIHCDEQWDASESTEQSTFAPEHRKANRKPG